MKFKLRTFFFLIGLFILSLGSFWAMSSRSNYMSNGYDESGEVDIKPPFLQTEKTAEWNNGKAGNCTEEISSQGTISVDTRGTDGKECAEKKGCNEHEDKECCKKK